MIVKTKQKKNKWKGIEWVRLMVVVQNMVSIGLKFISYIAFVVYFTTEWTLCLNFNTVRVRLLIYDALISGWR